MLLSLYCTNNWNPRISMMSRISERELFSVLTEAFRLIFNILSTFFDDLSVKLCALLLAIKYNVNVRVLRINRNSKRGSCEIGGVCCGRRISLAITLKIIESISRARIQPIWAMIGCFGLHLWYGSVTFREDET